MDEAVETRVQKVFDEVTAKEDEIEEIANQLAVDVGTAAAVLYGAAARYCHQFVTADPGAEFGAMTLDLRIAAQRYEEAQRRWEVESQRQKSSYEVEHGPIS